ncbi:MAG: RNB domain-containing ribonuclease, partial [Halohasta sp.]
MSDEQAQAGTAEGQGPVRITESIADQLAEKRADLFAEFEIRDEFPSDVLVEARKRTEDVYDEIEAEIDDRRDLRDLTTWTTDPADAQDFDDAISIDEDEEHYTLWVHIADVSHYVHPGSAMWAEALERCNTVYLPAYTVHMLPPVLAETVCSLVPNEDRLAHTVEMTIDRETLSFEEVDIYKSVIHSDERMTYTQAEDRIDEEGAPLHEECALVFELAEQLHQQRKEDG